MNRLSSGVRGLLRRGVVMGLRREGSDGTKERVVRGLRRG